MVAVAPGDGVDEFVVSSTLLVVVSEVEPDPQDVISTAIDTIPARVLVIRIRSVCLIFILYWTKARRSRFPSLYFVDPLSDPEFTSVGAGGLWARCLDGHRSWDAGIRRSRRCRGSRPRPPADRGDIGGRGYTVHLLADQVLSIGREPETEG